MHLYKYLKLTLLGTAAVAVTFVTAHLSQCGSKGFSCLQEFKNEKLVKNNINDSCNRLTDKILGCAAEACVSEEQKRYVKGNVVNMVCNICRDVGACSYSEATELRDKENEVAEGTTAGTPQPEKSSSCSAASSASGVLMLLAVQVTACTVFM